MNCQGDCKRLHLWSCLKLLQASRFIFTRLLSALHRFCQTDSYAGYREVDSNCLRHYYSSAVQSDEWIRSSCWLFQSLLRRLAVNWCRHDWTVSRVRSSHSVQNYCSGRQQTGAWWTSAEVSRGWSACYQSSSCSASSWSHLQQLSFVCSAFNLLLFAWKAFNRAENDFKFWSENLNSTCMQHSVL